MKEDTSGRLGRYIVNESLQTVSEPFQTVHRYLKKKTLIYGLVDPTNSFLRDLIITAGRNFEPNFLQNLRRLHLVDSIVTYKGSRRFPITNNVFVVRYGHISKYNPFISTSIYTFVGLTFRIFDDSITNGIYTSVPIFSRNQRSSATFRDWSQYGEWRHRGA